MRGQSRLAEHEVVLAEIVSIARSEAVDIVLVAGDLYETPAPAPEATALVLRTLLDLRATGAHVVAIAGNHDNALAFEALRPLAAEAGIVMRGRLARPDEGGLVELRSRAGERVRIAVVPFCSQRSIIRGAELLAGNAATNAGTYAERMRHVLAGLTASFTPDAVNLVVAHCMVRGGRLGGGERDAQSIEDYWIDATSFGGTPHYVALGHLHLAQQLPGVCPIWYCGSPLQVDFGEEGDGKHVLIVEAAPGVPASTPRRVPLSTPRRLHTLRGTLAELQAMVGETGDELLRIYVSGQVRAGLAEEVRSIFANAVDVIVEGSGADPGTGRPREVRPTGPAQLFGAFLESRGVDDPRLAQLFARLLDEQTAGEAVPG